MTDLEKPESDVTAHLEYSPETHHQLPDLKGVPQEDLEVYRSFAAKDEEWHAYQTKKLLRKVDIRLLPCLILMYLLNFLDRSNLAQARLGGLEDDLGMKGTDFNLATSILFVVSFESLHTRSHQLTELGVSTYATPLEPPPYSSSSIYLSRPGNVIVGPNLGAPKYCPLIWWSCCGTDMPWDRRSTVLPGRHYAHVFVVYPRGVDISNCLVLFR